MSITDEKAQRIAEEYAKNSFKDMTTPLLAMGYAKSYAQTIGHALYKNVKVIKAIKKIKADISEKTGLTIAQWLLNVQDTERRAKRAKDRTSEQRAQDMEAKHLGAYEADKKPEGITIFNIVKFSDVPALPSQKEPPKLVECTELVAEE